MALIYRCPKCDARFAPPLPEESECPRCGIWFHKWDAEPRGNDEVQGDAVALESPMPPIDPVSFYGRVAVLLFVTLWGVCLSAMDYRDAEINGSFMHNVVLPIHEAGHVFFMPFGEFMAILGGSLFQVALPLAIGAAFLIRQRDAFGAAICLWWTGASLVDLAPYIWDSLNPQLILIGGHTGAEGPHDWIYLLERLGALKHAHALGVTVHHFGVLVMVVGVLWGGRWLLQKKA